MPASSSSSSSPSSCVVGIPEIVASSIAKMASDDDATSNDERSSSKDSTELDSGDSDAAAAVGTRLFSKEEETSFEQAVFPVHEIRNKLLLLSELTGNLSRLFRKLVPMDDPPASADAPVAGTDVASSSSREPEIEIAMSKLLSGLVATACLCSVNLGSAIMRKMELNRRKYPVAICKVGGSIFTLLGDAQKSTMDNGIPARAPFVEPNEIICFSVRLSF